MTYDVDEVAELFSAHPNTVRQQVREGNQFAGIPAIRIGRKIVFSSGAVEKVLGAPLPDVEAIPSPVLGAAETVSPALSSWETNQRLLDLLASWRRPKTYNEALQNGNVYFLQGEITGLIKIGASTSGVEARIKDIRAMSPDRLRVLRILPGGHSIEAWLHSIFQPHRQHGEWFRADFDLLRLVDATLDLDARIPVDGRKSIPMFT